MRVTSAAVAIMASNLDDRRQEARLKILRMIDDNPLVTTRQTADQVGLSNGSAHYMLSALVEKGFVKLGKFAQTSDKSRYAYVLTPEGIRQKTMLTHAFLRAKRAEYDLLKEELNSLESELQLMDATPEDRKI